METPTEPRSEALKSICHGQGTATLDLVGAFTLVPAGAFTPDPAAGRTAGRAGASTPGQAGVSTPGQAGVSTPGQAGASTVGQAEASTVGQAGVSTPGQAGVSTPGQAGVSTPGPPRISAISRQGMSSWIIYGPTVTKLSTRSSKKLGTCEGIESMDKSVNYPATYFSADILREAVTKLDELSGWPSVTYPYLGVSIGGATWGHDNIEEFWADYRRSTGSVGFGAATNASPDTGPERALHVIVHGEGNLRETVVVVQAPARHEIEGVFDVFERCSQDSKLPEDPDEVSGKIFLGHGRSPLWSQLHNHLRDQHHLDVEAYEIGARAGHHIRDILESMLLSSSMAFLVMTAEDEMADEQFQARQNVVHELGLFQGRLGFRWAIAVVEEGTKLFTNMDGTQQIRFSNGNIQETFGHVLATIKTIKRETG